MLPTASFPLVFPFLGGGLAERRVANTFLTDAVEVHVEADVSSVDHIEQRGMIVPQRHKLEALQRELVASASPGTPFGELHSMCNRGIAEILTEVGILKVSAEEAFTERLVYPFFPHGLGHHLGIQVHDVGGKISAPDGSTVKPPATSPHLRSTRTLEASHVVTIEPGIYFIPMLLESHREGERSGVFDWALIDALTPFGGMRIEDDIHVTAVGPDDLSRPFVPGHR